MTEESDKDVNKRRASVLGPEEVGSYSPGIERLEKRASEELAAHDEECQAVESTVWMSDYSLYEHSLKLAQVMLSISKARGRDDRLVMVGAVSALLHDMGKLDEACKIYRLNRKLTTEEYAIINTHAHLSGHYVLERMSDVRPGDRAFLIDVYPVVRYHHLPWEISHPKLREIGFDLNLVDIFISLMENRHRPGLSQFQAVETLEEIVIKHDSVWRRSGCWVEVQASFQTIARLYGINRSSLLGD